MQNKLRNYQSAFDETGFADIGNPAINNDRGVDDLFQISPFFL